MRLEQQRAEEQTSKIGSLEPRQETESDAFAGALEAQRQAAIFQGKSVEEWLQQYAEGARQRQKRKRLGIGLAVNGSTIAIGAIGTYVGFSLISHNWSHLAWLPGFSGFSGLTGFVGIGMYADAKQREAATALAETDDVRAVGPLAESLSFQYTGQGSGIYQYAVPSRSQWALARLLPRLQASDARLLNAHQRTCLYRHIRLLMKSPYPPIDEALEFILAVLKALEQVGDRTAIPTVRSLLEAAPPAWGLRAPAPPEWGDRFDRIRKAAESCLQFLLTRTSQEDEGQDLLRASRIPDATPETLLRAAQSAGATAPEQLLRPQSFSLPDEAVRMNSAANETSMSACADSPRSAMVASGAALQSAEADIQSSNEEDFSPRSPGAEC